MTPKQALADLEKNKIWPIYYLYGDEPFKMKEFINKFKEILLKGSQNKYLIEKLDGAECDASEIVEKVQSMGLFCAQGDSRLVLVHGFQNLKDQDYLAKILMNSEKEKSPWGENCLVLIGESLDQRRKFHQWLKKQGYALEFTKAKNEELAYWMDFIAKKLGIEIDHDVKNALMLICDGSLLRLESEIEKLFLFSGAVKGTKINNSHLQISVSSGTHFQLIELVNTILEKKKTRALLLIDKLIHGPEDAIGLVGYMNWVVKNKKCQGFSGKDTFSFLKKLRALDHRLKSSGIEPKILIEDFILLQN